MNNLQLASSILVDPRPAFAALDKSPRFWFPLLAPVAAQVAMVFWYFGVVDYPWLLDEVFGPAASQQASTPSKSLMMWSMVVALALGVPLLRVLEAAYFWLAGRITNVQRPFRQWLALTCWSSFPYVLTVFLMVIPLLSHDAAKTTQDNLSLLSLNELVFHLPRDSRWHTLMSSITVLHPWLWWLAVVGVRVWSGRSLRFSMGMALLPMLVLYGGWVLLVLL